MTTIHNCILLQCIIQLLRMMLMMIINSPRRKQQQLAQHDRMIVRVRSPSLSLLPPTERNYLYKQEREWSETQQPQKKEKQEGNTRIESEHYDDSASSSVVVFLQKTRPTCGSKTSRSRSRSRRSKKNPNTNCIHSHHRRQQRPRPQRQQQRRAITKARMTSCTSMMMLLVIMFVLVQQPNLVSAKLRIPSTYFSSSNHNHNNNNIHNDNTNKQEGRGGEGKNAESARTTSTDRSSRPYSANNEASINNNDNRNNNVNDKNPYYEYEDYETIFNNWLHGNNNDGNGNGNAINERSSTSGSTDRITDITYINNNNIDEIPASSKDASSSSSPLLKLNLNKEYLLSRIGIDKDFIIKLMKFKIEVQQFVNTVVTFAWTLTNDIVRYKFPVGIVTAFVATNVLKRFCYKVQKQYQKHKQGRLLLNANNNMMMLNSNVNGMSMGNNGIDDDDDDLVDTYRYILRHTGRSLDLDSDDVTSYKYHGGIERVRARLIRAALSSSSAIATTTTDKDIHPSTAITTTTTPASLPVLSSSPTDTSSSLANTRTSISIENEQNLIEALKTALAIEFVPGGSHSEYVRKMIPSIAVAEEYANQLGITLNGDQSDSDNNHNNNSHNNKDYNNRHIRDDGVQQLLKIGLQILEIRALDSQLRSIRDRLIRTTFRLNRTVRYWKRKVEALSSSSSSPTTSSSSFSLSIPSLGSSTARTVASKWKRRLFRSLYSKTGGGYNSDKHNNSLLEGDRLRLAFAEAAYNAEVIRLGKILKLLNNRPSEMSDSTLTNALVEQQKQRDQLEQQQRQEQDKVDNYDGFDDTDENRNSKINGGKGTKRHTQMKRVRAMVVTITNKVRHRRRNDKIEDAKSKMDGTATAAMKTVVGRFPKSVRTSITAALIGARKKRKNISERTKALLSSSTVRFNADGRGKFSIQRYDTGSVTIENTTAKRILLSSLFRHRKTTTTTTAGTTSTTKMEVDDDMYDPQCAWLNTSSKWTLQARGLIVDVITETVQSSINPSTSTSSSTSSTFGGRRWRSSSSARNYYFDSKQLLSASSPVSELANLSSTWRIRHYRHQKSYDDENKWNRTSSANRGDNGYFNNNLQQRQQQWMVVYEMSRDINRLRRVGEGKSLKFRWKEVHWIYWLRQWDLMGIPSAGIKILIAMLIHNKTKPYVPKIKEVVVESYGATYDIVMSRFWMPFKDLVDELMKRKKRLVTGVSAREEEESLDIMLRDLGLSDGTPATRHEAIVKATRQYESDMSSGFAMWQNAFGGRLVRLILIQMQQLKVSMVDAAETIDYLFESNRINLQFLAVVPAVGILFFGAKVFFRFLFHVRSKDLRPIASVHADMTEYLYALESNVILRHTATTTAAIGNTNNHRHRDPTGRDSNTNDVTRLEEEEKQLGEFALLLYNYLVLLDYSSPQPFSSYKCDAIHKALTAFLGRDGSFNRDHLTIGDQIRLIDIVKDNHKELSKFL